MSGAGGHVFVVPALTATISGGNLYDLGLVAALGRRGVAVALVDPDGAAARLAAGEGGCFLVDSLFLDALPRLAASRRGAARLLLLAHYLPSLVAHGGLPPPAALGDEERAALAAADGFVAPSDYMAQALRALGAGARPVHVIAPGIAVPPPAAPATAPPLRALVLANLVPGKGVFELLRALAPGLAAGAPLALTIVGDATMDPAYAEACRALVASDGALAAAVRFAGPLPHAASLLRLAEAHLLVSASRMESFGLALAEARALGVPILARAGGNVAAHVAPEAGGELVADDEALAAALLRLAGEPALVAARRTAAQTHRPPPRSWDDAAAAYLAAVAP